MATLTLDPHTRSEPTEADRLAARNYDANAAAIARTQPRLAEALVDSEPDLAWVFGRDGYLTAFDPGEGEPWHTGCSVPLATARRVLKAFEAGTGVACFLCPTHAAQIRVVLELLTNEQALICIVPDNQILSILLHCDDFATDIAAGRLWFAWGEQWATELGRLLDEVPSLPTPSRFVRMPDADAAAIEKHVTDAQRVFSEQSARRQAKIALLRDRPESAKRVTPKACVITRSRFRLWDDASHTLHTALASGQTFELTHFDPDAPAGSSPLAFAQAAASADVVVVADVGRADVPGIVATSIPWITWVTTARIPAFTNAAPNDHLLLTDATWRSLAIATGWPDNRIGVAGWPMTQLDTPASGGLALIADTCSLDAPESLSEFSSHRVLWDKMRHVLQQDVFDLPTDITGWVRDFARRDDINPDALDVPTFVGRLVIPAYQHAMAEVLLAAGIPLKLHGRGWAELPQFAAHAAGEVTSRDDLLTIARECRALVHAWPTPGAHAIDALGRPVVRRTGRRRETLVRDARLALTADSSVQRAHEAPVPLSAELLASLLHRT